MRLFIIIPLLISLSVSFITAQVSAGHQISEFTKAIEDSPDGMKYKFYIMRGKAYWDSGDVNSALSDFSTSILLKPRLEAYKYRGEIYFEKKRHSRAIDDFTSAIEMNSSIDLYKLRGEAYLESGNYIMAMSDGSIIIDREPDISQNYNLMIKACEVNGEIELARNAARKAISIDRNNKVANDFLIKYPEQITLEGVDRSLLSSFNFTNVGEQEINSSKVNVKKKYYVVGGSTANAIRNDMNKKTPVRVNGVSYGAYTEWFVNWQSEWKKSNHLCTITNVETRVDVLLTLPKLKTSSVFPKSLEIKWKAYMRDLLKHERGHIKIGIEAAKEIEKEVKNLDPWQSCKQIEIKANNLAKKVLAKYFKIEKEFDFKTGHGRKNGTLFP